MITKIKLIDDIEEEKEEEELFKIVKIKPISTSIETQFGIGASAVGGDKPLTLQMLSSINLNYNPPSSAPIDKIKRYDIDIKRLEKEAEKSGGSLRPELYSAYEQIIEKYNKAVKEYQTTQPIIEGLPMSKPEDKPKPEVPSSQFGISELNKPEQMGKIQKGIISIFGTWEAKKRAMPELQRMEDLAYEVLNMRGINSSHEHAQIAYIYELLTTTETEVGVPMEETIKDIQSNLEKYGSISPPVDWKKAWKEEGKLKTALIGPSEKYGKAESVRRGFVDIAIKKESPGADFLSSLGWAGMVAIMGSQVVAGIIGGAPTLLRKLTIKVEDKVIPQKQAFEAIRKTTIGNETSYQRKIFDAIIANAEKTKLSVGQTIKGGFPYTETVPRFAFGGKLYVGVPIDEMVKSIVEVGKITKDIANQLKVMNPVDTGLVFQQLSIASPAIASKVASQFVELIPQEITKIPKVEEEMTKEEAEQFDKLKEAKIIPGEEIEPTEVELEEIERPEEKLPILTSKFNIEYPIHYFIKSDVVNKFTDAKTFKDNIEKARRTFVSKELDDLSNYNIEKEFGSLENYYNWVKDNKKQIENIKKQYKSFVNELPVDDKTKALWEKDPENLELNYEDYLKKKEKPLTPKEKFMAKMEEVRARVEPKVKLEVKHVELKPGEKATREYLDRVMGLEKPEAAEKPVQDLAPKPKVEPRVEVKPEVKVEPEAKTYDLKKNLTTPQKIQGNKLIGQIHKVVNQKGLTKVEFTALKRKYGLSPHLATPTRMMTLPQLQAVLQAVNRARPKVIGYKKVVTPKTEGKIQSLKDNLIEKLQMSEETYKEVLKDVGVYKEPKYVDAKHFITEKQGKDIIYRLIDEANILRIIMPFDRAVTENKPIKGEVDKVSGRIKSISERRLKDPHELNSMRLYIQKMETTTGAPFYPLYQDLINSHLENKKKLTQFIKGFEPYKKIITDDNELKKVNDYILAKSTLKDKPETPANITDKEIKLAKKIEDILKTYEAKARTEKFLDNIDHPEDMPQYIEFKKEIDKAKDIYESKGYDDLVEYMKTQKWGVIRSGYSPLQVISPRVRQYKPKAQTFGKTHIKTRTDIEYHEQDRNIIQRLYSYKKQMDNLVVMRPKVRALITLIDKNVEKFKDPSRITRNMEAFFRELKGYNRPENWFDRGLNRLYAQAMQTIILPSPVLSGRNLLQNIAFGHDKTLLIDPRNKSLTADEIDYLNIYISQMESMRADWLMIGEKPLPGLATLTKMVQKIGIYPYSDQANRHWGYWAKINQVKRAFARNVSLDKKMKAAKFSDMELTEQKMALQILAKDGEEAMARYVARVYVDNTQFLYDRSQRSLAEMGRVGRWAGNLMLFPRAYWEMLLKQSKKMTGKYVPIRERMRAFKVLAAVIGGGILVGAAYKKVTGRRENPYDPLVLLAYEPGGLAIGTVEAVTDVYVNLLMASKGDDRALAALTTAIPKAADMFIPFYAYVTRAFEASTDTKNIDRLALRKIRMMIDKEYEVRGGAYVLERNAMEKWQYFLSGAGIDVEIKEREAGKKKAPSPYLDKYKEETTVPSSYLNKYKR